MAINTKIKRRKEGAGIQANFQGEKKRQGMRGVLLIVGKQEAFVFCNMWVINVGE